MKKRLKMHAGFELSTGESLPDMTYAAQAAFDTRFEDRLANIDLRAVMAHVAEDTGMEGADLARAEELYRQFLTLKGRYPDMTVVPPKLVDTVWHTHITFTRQYMADCEVLFGEYLHHTPDVAGAEGMFETITVPAYQAEFGVNLKAYGLAEAAGCR
jgi:hypothetical protein